MECTVFKKLCNQPCWHSPFSTDCLLWFQLWLLTPRCDLEFSWNYKWSPDDRKHEIFGSGHALLRSLHTQNSIFPMLCPPNLQEFPYLELTILISIISSRFMLDYSLFIKLNWFFPVFCKCYYKQFLFVLKRSKYPTSEALLINTCQLKQKRHWFVSKILKPFSDINIHLLGACKPWSSWYMMMTRDKAMDFAHAYSFCICQTRPWFLMVLVCMHPSWKCMRCKQHKDCAL